MYCSNNLSLLLKYTFWQLLDTVTTAWPPSESVALVTDSDTIDCIFVQSMRWRNHYLLRHPASDELLEDLCFEFLKFTFWYRMVPHFTQNVVLLIKILSETVMHRGVNIQRHHWTAHGGPRLITMCYVCVNGNKRWNLLLFNFSGGFLGVHFWPKSDFSDRITQ